MRLPFIALAKAIMALVAFLAIGYPGYASSPALVPTPVVPDQAAAIRLTALINEYRASLDLPPVPTSRSLTAVAEAHIIDMASSADGGSNVVRGQDARGLPCNSHSWSGRGNWTPVCYTSDHAQSAGMWSKPREISEGRYSGSGYEIAYWTSGIALPDRALASWKGSLGHNNVVVEAPPWSGEHWQAMGVAVGGHYAFVWFGRIPDKE